VPTASDPASLLGGGGGSDVVMCPAIFRGSRALSIKKGVVVTACSKAHVFPRHDRTLPRRLQNVWTYGVIMTYKLCRQALQHRATMHHRAADRSWAWWAEATIRQDGATLGYDPTGQSYAADYSPQGKIDRTGRAMRRPHHHYLVVAFIALATA
jgi:hypothetical protein